MAAGTESHQAYERELGDHNARITSLEGAVVRVEQKIDASREALGNKLDQNTRWLIGTAISLVIMVLAIVTLTVRTVRG